MLLIVVKKFIRCRSFYVTLLLMGLVQQINANPRISCDFLLSDGTQPRFDNYISFDKLIRQLRLDETYFRQYFDIPNSIDHIECEEVSQTSRASGARIEEIFRWGTFAGWDISKANQLIQSGRIKPNRKTLKIRDYVENHLIFKENPNQKLRSIVQVQVDPDHSRSITDHRLKIPGLAIVGDFGLLIVDGNHRMLRMYLDGNDEMEFLVVDTKDADLFRITN